MMAGQLVLHHAFARFVARETFIPAEHISMKGYKLHVKFPVAFT